MKTASRTLVTISVLLIATGVDDILAQEPQSQTTSGTNQADALDPSDTAHDVDASAPSDAGDEDGSRFGGEISGDVALVSDYVDRGISNTDTKPALQAGLYYSTEFASSGIYPYIGFWGSNVDFADGGEATIELDALFGISGAIGDLEWDIGGAYYAYPGADGGLNYNYWEVPVGLSYPVSSRLSVTGSYFYAPDFSGGTGQAHYLAAGLQYERPIGPVVGRVFANTGHQWIEDNEAAGIGDYQDWSVGIAVDYKGLAVGLTYTDTDIGENRCFGGTNLCGARAVLSLVFQF